jgi:hypothetical protein
MHEWCRREDFRAVLPELLQGEDEDFAAYILKVATEGGPSTASTATRGRE